VLPDKQASAAPPEGKWGKTVALMKKNSLLSGKNSTRKGTSARQSVDDDSDEPQSLYLTPAGKFDLLNEYFGISSLPCPPCAGNERLMKKSIRRLKKAGALISGDYDSLWHVI